MKKLVLVTTLLLGATSITAQTLEELKKTQAAKKDSIAAIQGRVNAIQAQIDAIPGWKIGAFGTIGGNISGFNNWFAQGIPNNSAGNIGITINPYANLLQEKYFWRNSAAINLSWVKLDDEDDPTDDDSFREATDVFTVSSLFGYKLTKTLAVSVLGEYRTTLLNNFNDPGYLDLGVGGTWTPIKDLVVVVHPLNYNFVFSEGAAQYESSLGAKIVADYTRKIGAINFKTNLSAFLSYEDADYSNWTWTNSFSYTLWKAIGVGFDFGLRSNKQEAFNFALAQEPAIVPTPTLENTDNELQSFWNVGLSYSFQ
ncbi:DUF3078 domain-containing protein [Aquimarina sp. AD10]|uniref:DUF3078 domain-containing protein n=1 Tax=Aquimarina aggregata TaxID=1642818 RepID=A0A162ZUL7_9FLAO|nr:DUF3078 domain-containing protein [Aquimarina sp. AD10]KZS40047.1 hypothetical protein AWE51_08035 [Aquimarina aggregata]RKN02501.1 DUF3078 domain-containing protein [Aquimarina sp. AD10]